MSTRTSPHSDDLEIDDLVVRFPLAGRRLIGQRPVVHAVDGVSFAVPHGELVGLVGESGSGKSTIARAITGLSPVTSGSIRLGGTDLTALTRRQRRELRRSGRVQMIWQDPVGSLDPRRRIKDAIASRIHEYDGDERDGDQHARILSALEAVRLPESVLDRRPGQLSGGQNQRVAIARSLMGDVRVLIADEPTSALDVSVQADIGNRLVALNRERGMSCLVVSHDLGFISNIASHIVVLYLGRVMESGPVHDVVARPHHPYTAALLAAAPGFGGSDEHRSAYRIRGEIPSPVDPPKGCRFSSRCPFARDRCHSEPPAPRRTAAGTLSACHFANELGPRLEPIASEVLADQLPVAPYEPKPHDSKPREPKSYEPKPFEPTRPKSTPDPDSSSEGTEHS
ncbi:ABC transporter ATP-binding protein [Streptomyces sp. NPDC056390]|uniref:ABC transporter ATP-binding protein n=1 Tax=Streptomyces sp. NPDC056390 TaxID=3345806 RepID=UPI0035DF7C12